MTGYPENHMNEVAKDPSHAAKNSKPERLAKLVEMMRVLVEQKFTGSIKVNFSQGGIGRVEKFEEILK